MIVKLDLKQSNFSSYN